MKKNIELPKVDTNTYKVNSKLANKKYTLTAESQELQAKISLLANKITQSIS